MQKESWRSLREALLGWGGGGGSGGAKPCCVCGGGGSGDMVPRENLGTVWWHLMCLIGIFSEQIEPSHPEYFRAYSDITRANPSFFHRLMQKESWGSFS